MSKIIFDDLTKIPSIIAANRAKRPDKTGVEKAKKGSGAKKSVPKVDFFAKGNEHLTPNAVYQDQEDWRVRVFPNKYPLLDDEDHEVIVHSPDPTKDLEDFEHEQIAIYIRALLNRVDYYHSKEDKDVFIFNNRGGTAGASLTHPHSQLIAMKGFPGIIEAKKEEALHYYNEHSSCYWCDMLKKELKSRKRVVYESNHFVILSPKAPRWDYEMLLLPKKHTPNFSIIDETEINDLADVLKCALVAYNELFDTPDRNFWFYTQRYEPFHWHMGFIPHIKVFGGVELGAGIWVSSKATPEDAAKDLGKAVKSAKSNGSC
jgi:UDPglucose--hexose-1-phosphate uridylyltransferase